MEKSCPKASPRHKVNNPKQPLHARNSFKNKIPFKKPFKKLTLFVLSNPVPFNGQSYKKQKGP